MFHKLGSQRTQRDDQKLAAYLASIAGAVNSAGFMITGSFTSHVTGNVGRLADDLALGRGSLVALAAAAVTTFFAGSVAASMLIESRLLGRMSRTSAALLFTEALLIAAFSFTARPSGVPSLGVIFLSAAMGLQNTLVTRLSGAVVRTTHLTGVVTDLGIEIARWLRYWRAQGGGGMRLTFTSTPAPRPPAGTVALLGTIFASFVVGSAAGALLTVYLGHASLIPVVLLLVAGGVYALSSGRSMVSPRIGDGPP
jgi:uncharacterized membrane protein YoaK (UPF0700 family)